MQTCKSAYAFLFVIYANEESHSGKEWLSQFWLNDVLYLYRL